MELSSDLLVPVLLPWIMIPVSVAMVVQAARLLKLSDSVRNLLLLLVPLGNTSFLGIPMVRVFFGEASVGYALLYDQLGSFLALATYGTIVIAMHEPEGRRPGSGVSGILMRVVSFPPFVALLVAFAIRSFPSHPVFSAAVEVLSNTLVPLVMVAVGFRLRFSVPSHHRVPLAAGLGMKLVLAPLIALGGCRLLGLDGEAVNVSIFEAGMPPMVAAWALASRAGLHPDLGAAMVGLGIMLSFLTLPLLALVVQSL